jgi:hypothetical protein
MPGYEVFDYQYVPDESTVITSWNETVDPLPAYPPYPWSINQTDEWIDNGTLHFEVGTIKLDQTWETTYRLKVLKEGNINLFGNKSIITFNNGTGALTIPDTFVTAIPGLPANITDVQLTLDITDYTKGTVNDPVMDTIELNWTVGYSGFKAPVLMEVYYQNDNLSWIYDGSKIGDSDVENYPEYISYGIDVRDKPSGVYNIRVIAKVADHRDIVVTVGPIVVGLPLSYIRIE